MTSCDTGIIFDTYRGTTHDGPGLRSTVFFKGCPLRCPWCHNPEGIERTPAVWQDAKKCIGCGLCLNACLCDAICSDDMGLFTDKTRCKRCGACVTACPTGAMAFTGTHVDVEGLVHTLLKDKAYYDSFGGGVTASGGEPLLQAPFVAALFARLQKEGVHTALDTCGFAPYSAFACVLPHTNLLLYDLKILDSARHRQLTGNPNARILENAVKIADLARQGKVALWIRTPLIADATADAENIRAIAHFIHENLSGAVARWELCAFNNLCRTKYEKMRMEWAYAAAPLLSRQTVETLCTIASESGTTVAASGII